MRLGSYVVQTPSYKSNAAPNLPMQKVLKRVFSTITTRTYKGSSLSLPLQKRFRYINPEWDNKDQSESLTPLISMS
jgi:hypothetical protein